MDALHANFIFKVDCARTDPLTFREAALTRRQQRLSHSTNRKNNALF
jgi:hypothetical protein